MSAEAYSPESDESATRNLSIVHRLVTVDPNSFRTGHQSSLTAPPASSNIVVTDTHTFEGRDAGPIFRFALQNSYETSAA